MSRLADRRYQDPHYEEFRDVIDGWVRAGGTDSLARSFEVARSTVDRWPRDHGTGTQRARRSPRVDLREGLVTLRANPQDREAREKAELGRAEPRALQTYDPKNVRVFFGDQELTGFADDSTIEFERLEPDGGCSFTLVQESPFRNPILDWAFSVPEETRRGYLKAARYLFRHARRRARQRRLRKRGWA